MPVINQAELQKMIGGDEDLLSDLAIMFVKLLPDLESRIRFGIENHDSAEVESSAHQLKSRISYFGAAELRDCAGQLELAARKGQSKQFASLGGELFQGVEQLIEELRVLTNLSLEMEA